MLTIQRKNGIHHHKNCPLILQRDDFNTNIVIEIGNSINFRLCVCAIFFCFHFLLNNCVPFKIKSISIFACMFYIRDPTTTSVDGQMSDEHKKMICFRCVLCNFVVA